MASSAVSQPPVARVRNPGELVAVVPVLLGFHPRDSLVLIGTSGASGRRVGLTLRVDLPAPEDTALVCRSAADSILAGDPAGAAVVVLGGGREGTGGLPRRDVVDAAVRELTRVGVPAHTMVWAPRTSAGARWACYDSCGCSGELPDPAATAAAVAAVASGQVVYPDRADLERQVAPADPERLRRRHALLDREVDEALDADDPAAQAPTEALAVHWAALEGALTATTAGRLVVDDAMVLALAAALRVPAIRDIALASCAGPRAAHAEQLWAALARETPDPEAAEPATMLAVAALARGDGALANVALDRAQAAWPGHRLSVLLLQAVGAGLSPEQLRRWLREVPAAGPG